VKGSEVMQMLAEDSSLDALVQMYVTGEKKLASEEDRTPTETPPDVLCEQLFVLQMTRDRLDEQIESISAQILARVSATGDGNKIVAMYGDKEVTFSRTEAYKWNADKLDEIVSENPSLSEFVQHVPRVDKATYLSLPTSVQKKLRPALTVQHSKFKVNVRKPAMKKGQSKNV
jgi:hypothetical protein